MYRKTKFTILTVLILFIIFTTTSFFIANANNEVEFRDKEENHEKSNKQEIYTYNLDQNNNFQNSSHAFVYQNGKDNYTYISQKKSINSIENDEVAVFQIGNNNYSFVEQEGEGNVALIGQLGSKHKAVIKQFGDNNKHGIVQIGNNKNYQIVHYGSNDNIFIFQLW